MRVFVLVFRAPEMPFFDSDDSFPQYRTDVLTGRRCIVAPVRAQRPSDLHGSSQDSEPQVASGKQAALVRRGATDASDAGGRTGPTLSGGGLSADPFREGQEAETPPEILAFRSPESSANGPGWQLRVVPNRFPALAEGKGSVDPGECASERLSLLSSSESSTFDSMFPVKPAAGAHEVVIECPDSRSRLISLSETELHRVFIAWRTRVRALSETGRYASIVVFRNEGMAAGASLSHCHSQIMATTEMCPADVIRIQRADSHFRETGRILLDDLTEAERRCQARIICETSRFTALCPFASRRSWHVRCVPRKRLCRSFADADDSVLEDLAGVVRRILVALEQTVGQKFSFNCLMVNPPALCSGAGQAAAAVSSVTGWMFEILPRTGQLAGWELASDVDILAVAPEEAARQLRQHIAPCGCDDGWSLTH